MITLLLVILLVLLLAGIGVPNFSDARGVLWVFVVVVAIVLILNYVR